MQYTPHIRRTYVRTYVRRKQRVRALACVWAQVCVCAIICVIVDVVCRVMVMGCDGCGAVLCAMCCALCARGVNQSVVNQSAGVSIRCARDSGRISSACCVSCCVLTSAVSCVCCVLCVSSPYYTSRVSILILIDGIRMHF